MPTFQIMSKHWESKDMNLNLSFTSQVCGMVKNVSQNQMWFWNPTTGMFLKTCFVQRLSVENNACLIDNEKQMIYIYMKIFSKMYLKEFII